MGDEVPAGLLVQLAAPALHLCSGDPVADDLEPAGWRALHDELGVGEIGGRRLHRRRRPVAAPLGAVTGAAMSRVKTTPSVSDRRTRRSGGSGGTPTAEEGLPSFPDGRLEVRGRRQALHAGASRVEGGPQPVTVGRVVEERAGELEGLRQHQLGLVILEGVHHLAGLHCGGILAGGHDEERADLAGDLGGLCWRLASGREGGAEESGEEQGAAVGFETHSQHTPHSTPSPLDRQPDRTPRLQGTRPRRPGSRPSLGPQQVSCRIRSRVASV